MVDVAHDDDANVLPPEKTPPSGFPERYIVFGVFVGLFLTLLGVAILSVGPIFSLDNAASAAELTTCVGFGIILAAFGARASGSWAGWSAAGAGAMAVLLFVLLQHYAPTKDAEFMTGSLEGDFSKVADLRIIDQSPMYVYRDRGTSTINFLNVGRQLRSHRVRVQVDTVEKEEYKQYFQLIGDAKVIQQIQEKKTGPILWTFDYANRRVLDGDDVIFSERGTILGAEGADNAAAEPVNWWNWSAYAGSSKGPELDEAAIAGAIAGLESEDTFVRRNARDTLALAGTAAIRPLFQAWHAKPDEYRLKLGATYALNEMLHADPEKRAAISAEISSEDFPLLVDAASDPDKTVRFQAAEFLYLLEDPRSVELSVEAAKQASDNATATNQILILRQSAQSLAPDAKSGIVEQLQAPSVGGTNRLIRDKSILNNVLKW